MCKVTPIQFAMPTSKLSLYNGEKETFFSCLSPMGKNKKYTFFEEEEYYRHYSKSFFAVTMKKGGWDCLRHYEILSAGTLPYFLEIEDCPKDTLISWPKDLLAEIKRIPGMPSEQVVKEKMETDQLDSLEVNANFDTERYWQIHSKFMEIFHRNLTTRGLGDYFQKAAELTGKSRILFCFGIERSIVDYQRDLLMVALAESAEIDLTVYPNPFWQLKSCHRQILNTLYGRGFTSTANLSDSDFYSPPQWETILEKIDTYDAIVACSSSNKGFSALPVEVQSALRGREDIIWIDGMDIRENHEVPTCARLVFRREMGGFVEPVKDSESKPESNFFRKLFHR